MTEIERVERLLQIAMLNTGDSYLHDCRINELEEELKRLKVENKSNEYKSYREIEQGLDRILYKTRQLKKSIPSIIEKDRMLRYGLDIVDMDSNPKKQEEHDRFFSRFPKFNENYGVICSRQLKLKDNLSLEFMIWRKNRERELYISLNILNTQTNEHDVDMREFDIYQFEDFSYSLGLIDSFLLEIKCLNYNFPIYNLNLNYIGLSDEKINKDLNILVKNTFREILSSNSLRISKDTNIRF